MLPKKRGKLKAQLCTGMAPFHYNSERQSQRFEALPGSLGSLLFQAPSLAWPRLSFIYNDNNGPREYSKIL